METVTRGAADSVVARDTVLLLGDGVPVGRGLGVGDRNLESTEADAESRLRFPFCGLQDTIKTKSELSGKFHEPRHICVFGHTAPFRG